MNELIKKLEELLALVDVEKTNYPQESPIQAEFGNVEDSVNDLLSYLEPPKPKNLIFGEFSMRNRLDVVDNMPLTFLFDDFGVLKTKANYEAFKNSVIAVINNPLIYLYYWINAATNDIIFYFAFESDKEYEGEISLLIGAKKYTFGKMHTNKVYARYDSLLPNELILPNNRGFALNYNLMFPTEHIDKLFNIETIGGTLADLRFLSPADHNLMPLVNKFKDQKWLSIITQAGKYTLKPDGTYLEAKYK